jgi:membrane associated rhomboid family serine protease
VNGKKGAALRGTLSLKADVHGANWRNDSMGGLIPLTDASRRPVHFPIITTCIILANFFVFAFELWGGDAFVLRWAAVAANITAGHDWITILTAMFMHGSWSHILGNMVFLWAFGPEIEDSMNPLRYLTFYLGGGLVAMLAQIAVSPSSTVPNLGASGAIAAVMGAFLVTFPRDQIRAILIIFVFVRITLIPAALLIGFWFLIQLLNVGSVAAVQTGGVAYVAHVGGFIFGAATARLFEDPRRLAD